MRSKKDTKIRRKRRASQVIRNLYNSQLQKAFRTWVIRINVLKQREHSMEKIRKEKLKRDRMIIKRTIERLSRRHLFSAFSTWVRHTNTLSIMYTMVGREKSNRKKTITRKCFTYWLNFCNQRIQDRTNVKKILKRLQNKLLFSGFQKWYITIVKTRNVQQNMQLKEESEQYLQNYQRLEFENQKLKHDIQARDDVLQQMEKALISAKNNVRLTKSIKEALNEENVAKKQLELQLEKFTQENEELKQNNSEIKLRMERILAKKRELQLELSIRSDRNVTYKYRYETLRDENEDLKDSLQKSQGMYREVKEKLLRSLTLLEDQKGQLKKETLVKVLKTDVENKTLVLNEQGEQILILRQRIAKMRNTIKDLREDRVLAKKTAENEKLKADAAIHAAVNAAVAKAAWRIENNSPLKRTYTTPSSLRRNNNFGSSSSSSRRNSSSNRKMKVGSRTMLRFDSSAF